MTVKSSKYYSWIAVRQLNSAATFRWGGAYRHIGSSCAMMHRNVLCFDMLSWSVLWCTVFNCAMMYAMMCCLELCYDVLFWIVLWYTVLNCALMCCLEVCFDVLSWIVLWCTVLWCYVLNSDIIWLDHFVWYCSDTDTSGLGNYLISSLLSDFLINLFAIFSFLYLQY